MRECFHCKQPIKTITDDFLGDVICPTCRVMNSFYNPKDYKPLMEPSGSLTDDLLNEKEGSNEV